MKTVIFKMLTLGILSLFACSCATQTCLLTPEEVERGAPAKTLIIMLNDGSEVKLTGARLEQAKLIGLTEGKDRREIDLASIQAVQMMRSDYSLAVVGMGVAAVTAWLVIGATTAPAPPGESCPFIYSFDGEQ